MLLLPSQPITHSMHVLITHQEKSTPKVTNQREKEKHYNRYSNSAAMLFCCTDRLLQNQVRKHGRHLVFHEIQV